MHFGYPTAHASRGEKNGTKMVGQEWYFSFCKQSKSASQIPGLFELRRSSTTRVGYFIDRRWHFASDGPIRAFCFNKLKQYAGFIPYRDWLTNSEMQASLTSASIR